MDDRIFDVHLTGDGQEECELSLPVTPYQLLDAMEKLQTADSGRVCWEITEYHAFEELSEVISCGHGLCELNVLAQKLAELDGQQGTAFAGLLRMEQAKGEPISLPRLIDLAYSTDCCHVLPEAMNDGQLGRFYAENGFVPELDELPDRIFELLDFEKIGREARLGEGGVFVERTMDHPGGYVVQSSDLVEAYRHLAGPPDRTDQPKKGGMEMM